MAVARTELEERTRLRPLIPAAVQTLMTQHRFDEAAASRHLRREAMGQRVDGGVLLPGAWVAHHRERPSPPISMTTSPD
jgi:ANTAR domain